jgi:hypothetical protein
MAAREIRHYAALVDWRGHVLRGYCWEHGWYTEGRWRVWQVWYERWNRRHCRHGRHGKETIEWRVDVEWLWLHVMNKRMLMLLLVLLLVLPLMLIVPLISRLRLWHGSPSLQYLIIIQSRPYSTHHLLDLITRERQK